MKHIINILMLLPVLWLAACDSDKDTDTKRLTIVSSVVDFPASESLGNIIYRADAKADVTSSDEDWCLVTRISYDEVGIKVLPNPSMTSRGALITLRVGSDVRYIPVTQAGVVFSLEESTVFIPNDGETVELEYNSAIAPVIEYTSDWLKCVAEDGIIYFSAGPNLDQGDRSTEVAFKGVEGGKPVVLTVVQYGLTIEMDDSPITIGIGGETVSRDFICLVPPVVTYDAPWLEYKVEGNTIEFTAGPNPDGDRSVVVSIAATETGTPVVITVTQAGVHIDLGEEFLIAEASGGIIYMPYTSEVTVTVDKNEGWLTCTVEDERIAINVTANPEGKRKAVVTLSGVGSNVSESFTVYQRTADPATFPSPNDEFVNVPADTESVWYFDPAKMGPVFKAAWDAGRTNTYRIREMSLGVFQAVYGSNYPDPKPYIQALRVLPSAATGTIFTTGYNIIQTALDYTEDIVELTNNYSEVNWPNDEVFLNVWPSGAKEMLGVLTGSSNPGNKKQFRIEKNEDGTMTFTDVADAGNWFTLTRTVVSIPY